MSYKNTEAPNSAKPSVDSVMTTKLDITVMSHEHHAVPNHWWLHCLFNHLQTLCYWPFESGIHRSPLDFFHQWPVTLTMILCHDVIMDLFLLLYPPASTKLKGGILVSRRPFVCGQNRVRSVSSTILVRSISYLHISSSNFRRCVACKGYCKIPKFWNL